MIYKKYMIFFSMFLVQGAHRHFWIDVKTDMVHLLLWFLLVNVLSLSLLFTFIPLQDKSVEPTNVDSWSNFNSRNSNRWKYKGNLKDDRKNEKRLSFENQVNDEERIGKRQERRKRKRYIITIYQTCILLYIKQKNGTQYIYTYSWRGL